MRPRVSVSCTAPLGGGGICPLTDLVFDLPKQAGRGALAPVSEVRGEVVGFVAASQWLAGVSKAPLSIDAKALTPLTIYPPVSTSYCAV